MTKSDEFKKVMKKLSDPEPFSNDGQDEFEKEIAEITDFNIATEPVVEPTPSIAAMIADLKQEEKDITVVLTDNTVEERVKNFDPERQKHAYLTVPYKRSWAGIYDLAKVIEYLEVNGYIDTVNGPTKRPSLYDLDDYARVLP